MNQSSNNYHISNEQVQLVNILERMYNDNIRQINGMTNSINNLRNSNTHIRNLLVQILNTNTNTNTRNISRRANENLNRIILNNVPYVIDYVEQYRIPSRIRNNNQERNTRFMQNFLEPVEVYPTQSQIESATRYVQYCDIVNPINRSCPISLETFNDTDMVSVIRFCGHIFKSEDLRRWFRTNCRCPVCRYDIRNFNSNSSSEIDSSSQPDVSNNFVNENQSSEINEEIRPNTITTYLDLIFDNGTSTSRLSESLLNEITNMVDTTDANALLTLLNASLQRR
jgi:hypothetical protein